MILSTNIIDETTTITATGSYAKQPLSNLLDYQLYRYTKIPAGEQHIDFALQTAQTIDAVGLAGHTLTSATLILSNDATFATTLQSVSLDCTTDTILQGFTATTAQYARLILNDSYIKKIGNFRLGVAIPSPLMNQSQTFTYTINDSADESISFQSFGSEGYEQRSCKIKFPYLTTSERDEIITLFRQFRNWKPFYFTLWDNDTKSYNPLYARIGANSIEVTRSGSLLMPYVIEITLKEVC